MGAAIEIRGMSKRFGKVEAVTDLSFEVEAGRVTGFLGPNGAGKSTAADAPRADPRELRRRDLRGPAL